MHNLFPRFLSLASALVGLVLANTGMDPSIFEGWQPVAAAQAGAPMFHFADGSCLPSSAFWDGKITKGAPLDACILGNLHKGCPDQPAWAGFNTRAHDFPTYYIVRKCDDGTIRVVYDLFFTHDSGHTFDWEWVVVVWKQYNGLYYRDSVILEQDGDHVHVTWGDIPNTFQGGNDMFNDNQRYLDHPKIYSNKYHHAMHINTNGHNKDNCAVSSNNEFRMNDYYYNSADWLADGDTVKQTWGDLAKLAFQQADSYPDQFWGGHKYDVCKL